MLKMRFAGQAANFISLYLCTFNDSHLEERNFRNAVTARAIKESFLIAAYTEKVIFVESSRVKGALLFFRAKNRAAID